MFAIRSVLCYNKIGDRMHERLCNKFRDRMWPRVNKKKVLRRIEILTYWSIVSGIIYVHAINNAVTQRNRTNMY